MKKILLVGQTPPPFGGQAIMIQNMLKADFDQVKFYHLRMDFSADMDEIGKFKIKKIFKLIELIFSIYYLKFRHQIDTVYYPPAPPLKVPMLRDIVILNATRWLFKTTIFHFHAAGISEMHGQLKGLTRKLYESAYFFPDICIRLSEYNPEDGKAFHAKNDFVIPYGIQDSAEPYLNAIKTNPLPIILSVSVICESKGILILLESTNILAKKGYSFKVRSMGRFESEDFKQKVMRYIEANSLENFVEFVGVKTGEEKFACFAQADIFCFPTFFEAESFGLVALEAMQFELPVVATNWRGVPSVVEDNKSGFLVPPRDAQALADKLEVLLLDPDLRIQMGQEGRRNFLHHFTTSRFTENLQQALISA